MFKTSILQKIICVIAFGLSMGSGTAGISQTVDIDALRVAAVAGDANAQLQLGEILLFASAGNAQEIDDALKLIGLAASGGSVLAKARLGKTLLDGYYTSSDVDAGIALLEEAAAKGNVSAKEALADAYLWGLKTKADPLKTKVLLEDAIEHGSRTAVRVLGEQLIGGWVLERDIDSGLPLLKEAAATGDAKAQIALGKFLFYGSSLPQDKVAALELFEAAAKLGDGSGLRHYGSDLMWREAGASVAEDYLTRSGELGVGAAWSSLAEGAMYGYLGLGHRARFGGFAAKAVEMGETRIAVLEAERQLFGINMRASGPKAIAGLEHAAAGGNVDAIRYLIALVRNGNQWNVRKSPDRAAAYLVQFSEFLSENEEAQLALTVDAARVKRVEKYGEIADRFFSRPDLKSVAFGKEIFAANPNFAIFLLQTNMQRADNYAGAIDGFAGKRTLRAIKVACQVLDNKAQCGHTPLHSNVIGRLLAQ